MNPPSEKSQCIGRLRPQRCSEPLVDAQAGLLHREGVVDLNAARFEHKLLVRLTGARANDNGRAFAFGFQALAIHHRGDRAVAVQRPRAVAVALGVAVLGERFASPVTVDARTVTGRARLDLPAAAGLRDLLDVRGRGVARLRLRAGAAVRRSCSTAITLATIHYGHRIVHGAHAQKAAGQVQCDMLRHAAARVWPAPPG